MRVAIFLDGKNFYEAMRRFDPLVELDFDRLARWVTGSVGGANAEFVGAYYYTGFSPDPAVGDVQRAQALSGFLDYLSTVRGFFVRREPRVVRETTCRVCGQAYGYSTEKRVDTRVVADLIHYAAVDAYDIAVLASGDDDFVPAVEAADRLGKRVYIGVWPGQPVARDLRSSVFGCVDFGVGLPEFTRTRGIPATPPNDMTARPGPSSTEVGAGLAELALQAGHEAILKELENAESQLPYVSRWYFLHRWRGEGLTAGPVERERLLEDLVRAGRVVRYEMLDARGRNTEALRLRESAREVARVESGDGTEADSPPRR